MGAIYKNFPTSKDSEIEALFSKPFKDCAKYIASMDTMKKADMAAQIQPVLDHLYFEVNKYGNKNYDRDEQISPDAYIYIMGKIKRWETIIYWLYEIDIMMEETNLDKLIHEAENRLAANGNDSKLSRIRVRDVYNEELGITQKQRVTVNAKEDLNTLYMERMARGNHTEEIMEMAKNLSIKYCNSK
ncbi:MAG: hypothetical protein RR324_01170 [Cellulosilyticaceae bacterium]